MLLIRRLLDSRRSRRPGILMAALIAAMLAPWLHVADGHDRDDGPAIVVHDASQHRLEADQPASADVPLDWHCLACHVVRLVRDTTVVSPAAPPSTMGMRARAGYLAVALVRSVGPPLPARAPPSFALA